MNFNTISEVQVALIKGETSCTELVNHYLNRIESANEKLNVFLTVTKDVAYEKARKLDNILRDEKGDITKKFPLFGTVVSYKDLFSTESVRTTAGSKVLESYIPVYSATVVQKMEEAGAIMIGKTNCDAWAHGASGENSDFGPTLNPHNTDYVPGGSSSGSAVSVATGMNMVSFGTDTGGSIRQPANFCGVVGLKPSYGSVSRYGVIAMASSLDSIGHFTTNVKDSKKIFQVTRGLDGLDATLKEEDAPIPDKMTIGIPEEYFGEGVDGSVAKGVQEAIDVFKSNGYKFKTVNLPNTKHAISVYYIIQPAEVSSNLGRFDGIRFGGNREKFGPEAKRRIMLGTFVLSSGYFDAYYKKATEVRTLIIKDFDRVFDEVDLIIAPVSPTAAFKLGEKVNDPLKMYLSDIFTVPANIAGIPGISVPFGKKDGLPLGFQLMGPRFSEKRLFAVASDFEKFTDYDFKPVV